MDRNKHVLFLLLHLWVGWVVADVGWAQMDLTPGCVLSPRSALYVPSSWVCDCLKHVLLMAKGRRIRTRSLFGRHSSRLCSPHVC